MFVFKHVSSLLDRRGKHHVWIIIWRVLLHGSNMQRHNSIVHMFLCHSDFWWSPDHDLNVVHSVAISLLCNLLIGQTSVLCAYICVHIRLCMCIRVKLPNGSYSASALALFLLCPLALHWAHFAVCAHNSYPFKNVHIRLSSAVVHAPELNLIYSQNSIHPSNHKT